MENKQEPTAQFDLDRQLSSLYAAFPEAGERPVIGITGNYAAPECKLGEAYYKAVEAAGGTPLIIPPLAGKAAIVNTLDRIDALLLSGGADINPLFSGEEPQPGLHSINRERDLPELLAIRLAYNRQLPMLGICRGMQALAVALGGKVAQDIAATAAVKHSQDADRDLPTHTVSLAEGSTLRRLYGTGRLAVNSFHHQAVAEAGPRFTVTATAADGTAEAMESSELKSVIGVQWHPECLADGDRLFGWLVAQAASYRQARKVHERVLTLDTHCDTPMLFAQGVDFGSRDKRLLVDLHKMYEGRQDATIMVAYLPQPKPGERFADAVPFKTDSPTAYADLIFDKIEAMVAANSSSVAIARTPQELADNKIKGLKSVMLGIENGLALGHDLANIGRFRQRGVVYITLCHNGDNDICDSARGCNTHGGVSQFGADVIAEMNRRGVMVDLSHASESSFYDALAMSRLPIVCSHSSSRALCDHPRNLTDDQMKALAAKGGVAQTTLYHGFLRTDGEATVLDALAHLDHAIAVMGIDHVGIGTDFDGDGGVKGFADSSEAISFTRRLLARRYSEADIQKIWGGNFMRVMAQVQAAAEP